MDLHIMNNKQEEMISMLNWPASFCYLKLCWVNMSDRSCWHLARCRFHVYKGIATNLCL